MPKYEYKCDAGHTFTKTSSVTDYRSQVLCDVCFFCVAERVFTAVPVHYKGTGFYTTDYGKA
jgi:putative FmdB family regulatory protein